jgi:hypothetical protein
MAKRGAIGPPSRGRDRAIAGASQNSSCSRPRVLFRQQLHRIGEGAAAAEQTEDADAVRTDAQLDPANNCAPQRHQRDQMISTTVSTAMKANDCIARQGLPQRQKRLQVHRPPPSP